MTKPEQTTSEREREIRAKEFWDRLPHCAHYPTCDGDLVGESHSAECPLYKIQREPTMFEFAEAFADHKHAVLLAQLDEARKKLQNLIPVAESGLKAYEHDSILYGCAEHLIAEAERVLKEGK